MSMPGANDPNINPFQTDRPVATSGKAIASLVLGLLSCCFSILAGIPALILGGLSLGDINRSGGRLTGRGFAIAGMVLGGIGTLGSCILVPMLMQGVQKARFAARRIESANHLRTIGLAMQTYESDKHELPPAAITGPDGRPLLSWRVALLPKLEQEALYQQFHLNEPWDSAHNKALLPLMPKIYLHSGWQGPAEAQRGLTYYQAFVGPNTVLRLDRSPSLAELANMRGAGQYLLVVEAGTPVPWTKPEDIHFGPGQPLPKLGGPQSGGFNALFADGNVDFLPQTFDEKTFRKLIER
jgi:prepilin-type processing-associated H-X9-DG protein